jgi:rhodanese-related sulfurtransferase
MENGRQAGRQANDPLEIIQNAPGLRPSPGEDPGSPTHPIPSKLNRPAFQLRVLSEMTRSLKNRRDTEESVEAFLLFLLAQLEIEQGTIVLIDPKKGTSSIHRRGLEKEIIAPWSEEDVNSLTAYLTYLMKKAVERHLPSSEAHLFPAVRPLHLKQLFNQDPVGFWFVFSETQLGFVALWEKRTPGANTNEGHDLLNDLINTFILFLERAKSLEKVRDLTRELEQRQGQLQKISVDLKVSEQRIKAFEKTRPKIRQAIKKEIERTRQVSAMDVLLIIGIGLVLGLVFNLINPGGISPIPQVWLHPSLPQINVHSAKQKLDAGAAVLVDARPNNLFTKKHIPGAVNLPLNVFDFVYMMKFSRLDPEQELIVYGRNISRHYDQEMAYRLAARGHTKVMVLSGGLPAWQEKGYPTEP